MRTSSYLSAIFIVAVCAQCVGRQSAYAQQRSLDDIARGGASYTGEDQQETEPIKGKVFSPFRSKIRALCSSLELDKRREQLLQIANVAAANEKGCRACAPLGRLFQSSCEAAKAPRGLSEVASGRLQREPHPSVIEDAGELGRDLASDTDAGAESAIFMKRMFASSKDLSPAGQDYFASLEEALARPLRRFLSASSDTSAASGTSIVKPLSQHEREEMLNDMF